MNWYTSLEYLPVDIIKIISLNLPIRSLLRLSQVSRRFRDIIRRSELVKDKLDNIYWLHTVHMIYKGPTELTFRIVECKIYLDNFDNCELESCDDCLEKRHHDQIKAKKPDEISGADIVTNITRGIGGVTITNIIKHAYYSSRRDCMVVDIHLTRKGEIDAIGPYDPNCTASIVIYNLDDEPSYRYRRIHATTMFGPLTRLNFSNHISHRIYKMIWEDTTSEDLGDYDIDNYKNGRYMEDSSSSEF